MGGILLALLKLSGWGVPGCQVCGPGFGITSRKQDSLLRRIWSALMLH